jgi:hypothetical protein
VLRAITSWTPGHTPQYGLTVPVVVSARKATIFGVHLYDKLLFPHTPGMGLGPSIVAFITVALSATTTFMTVRQSAKRGLMQTNVDPNNPMAGMQKYMQYVVPFFSLTGLYWQYGLVLYWVTTNVWTLGQQYFMFRNWTTEDTPVAGATAAAGSAARSTQSSARPASGARSGPAKTGTARTGPAKTGTAKTGTAKTGTAKTATGTAKTAPGETTSDFDPRAPKPGSGGARTGTAKTASGETTSDFDPRAPKPASGGARTGTSNGRPASSAPRAKTGSGSAGAASSTAGRVQTGSAARDAAANTPGPANGQNGAPTTKVVRQQPVRQAKSKRSGKR